MDFKNKTALITGSARGLGKAIAAKLAGYGARVVISDVQMDLAETTAAEFAQKGYNTIAVRADVSKSDDVKKLIEETIAAFDSIDIVINNAGITRDALILRMTEDAWDTVIRVNLKGTFLVTQAAAKIMIKQRSGRIINISSIVGRMGNAGQANYSASKAGVIGLTKSAARELASRNITVNAIAPGFIETEMTKNLPQEVREAYMQSTPLRKFGSPDDVAAAVAFLASDEAAYITGQIIGVDGGLFMC
nr:3-oxoacyl-[acyl-carrier-protein] reductase [candidate division Zixibacteria bacterium]